MKNPSLVEWHNAHNLCAMLTKDGWASPDTYSAAYKPIASAPAVYMFLLFNQDSDYRETAVAYVGMSTNLQKRLKKHNILPEISEPQNNWVMRWFKETSPILLREEERVLISKYNPPWNIIGRRRGVELS